MAVASIGDLDFWVWGLWDRRDSSIENNPHSYIMRMRTQGGHSITKHTGEGAGSEGMSQNPQNIYPKIAILEKC